MIPVPLLFKFTSCAYIFITQHIHTVEGGLRSLYGDVMPAVDIFSGDPSIATPMEEVG